MHKLLVLFLAFVPSQVFAQDDATKETLKWVLAQEAPTGGFYPAPQDPNIDAKPVPSLRATLSAVRAIIYLRGKVPNADKHEAFVLECFDAKTGGFAEPGGKPDVAITSVGVMAAMELEIPKKKFAKAMDYLKENAKTFEEVRIGAAAVEAWGVKDCPFKVDTWVKVAEEFVASPNVKEDQARAAASATALIARLGEPLPLNFTLAPTIMAAGQRKDGGWGQAEGDSDIASTYRVMRAFMLLKEKPKDVKKLREFIASHRNKDGGYATKPGDTSSVSGVYYAVIIGKWLNEMEAKK